MKVCQSLILQGRIFTLKLHLVYISFLFSSVTSYSYFKCFSLLVFIGSYTCWSTPPHLLWACLCRQVGSTWSAIVRVGRQFEASFLTVGKRTLGWQILFLVRWRENGLASKVFFFFFFFFRTSTFFVSLVLFSCDLCLLLAMFDLVLVEC